MIFILTSHQDGAARVAQRLELDPRRWRFLARAHDLLGAERPIVIAEDHWQARDDSFEIQSMLAARNAEVWHL